MEEAEYPGRTTDHRLSYIIDDIEEPFILREHMGSPPVLLIF
jgi:hypothetical protein